MACFPKALKSGILYIHGISAMYPWEGVHPTRGFCTYKVGFCTGFGGKTYMYPAAFAWVSGCYAASNK